MNSSDIDNIEISQLLLDFDKLLEHRARLAIMSLLNLYDKIAFKRFKQLLNETDGNLGAQLRKLEEAGYITVNKEFENRRPVSWYSATKQGRVALTAHLNALVQLAEVGAGND